MMPIRLRNSVVAAIAVLLILVVGFSFWAGGRYAVPIITYHSIASVEESHHYYLSTVSEESFKKQMQFLKEGHYQVIAFDTLVGLIKDKKPLPPKSVVIHFDDGYEDNYTKAYPILKKHGFTATIFLVSDFVGTTGYVNWEQMKEMQANGVVAGAHTRQHKYLPGLSKEEKWDQIANSKKIIEEKLGQKVDYFVYPSGGFDAESKLMVKEAGFLGAATTNRGFDRLNQDVYELKRIRIKDTDHGFALWSKLSGYYNLFRKSKSGS